MYIKFSAHRESTSEFKSKYYELGNRNCLNSLTMYNSSNYRKTRTEDGGKKKNKNFKQ